MKALLLSAGFGKRLGSITSKTPKCLLKINGIEILELWITKLKALGVEEFIINTHFLHEQIEKFASSHALSQKIRIVYEERLLGTAGTIRENGRYFSDHTFIVHSDNLCDDDLTNMVKKYHSRPKHCLATMLTFKPKSIVGCGLLKTDNNDVMIDYQEKPKCSDLTIANGAVFLVSKGFLSKISNEHPNAHDLCADVIPQMNKLINCYHTTGTFLDIGTPETLKLASVLCKRDMTD